MKQLVRIIIHYVRLLVKHHVAIQNAQQHVANRVHRAKK